MAIPKPSFKERRRPSSAAEIAAVSVRDNLFWVRPPSRQVSVRSGFLAVFDCMTAIQLPPPEALHLNAPRKEENPRFSSSDGHGPERRRSNSAIGMCATASSFSSSFFYISDQTLQGILELEHNV